MTCFIHLKNESTAFCKKCRRPICDACASLNDGVCVRCSNFIHTTLYNYDKKVLPYFLIFTILRILFFYDCCVYIFKTNGNIDQIIDGLGMLCLFYLPFLFNVLCYGLKEAVNRQIKGVTNPHTITDSKRKVTLPNMLYTLLALILGIIGSVVISGVFIITDVIHLIILIKEVIYHKKHIVSEQEIIFLGGKRC